ncbi:MAG: glutamine synthetase type III, partial [Ruminococcus sp.]|nr:glutamine synthetase type III [Ruminococcus sp.]
SPFAFTGNRFEFRMVVSSYIIACPNALLNTIVAEELSQFTEILEPFSHTEQFESEVKKLMKNVLRDHRRIIFNGDGYSAEWVEEAERRGLPNYSSTVDSLPHYTDEKNLRIFKKFGIYTENELKARQEVLLEKYSKTIRIEARTMIQMARKQLLPATLDYIHKLCEAVAVKKQIGILAKVEQAMAEKLTDLTEAFYVSIEKLESLVNQACEIKEILPQARFFHDEVLTEMERMRTISDTTERIMPSDKWPIPDYSAMIYNV